MIYQSHRGMDKASLRALERLLSEYTVKNHNSFITF